MSGKVGAKRLSFDEVLSARRSRAAGEKVADIAASLGVTPSCIARVTTGSSHKHIRGDESAPLAKPRTYKRQAEQTQALANELASLRPNSNSMSVQP